MKKIFNDEKSKGLKEEYNKEFDEYPSWAWQQETVDQCYARVKKEIEEKYKDDIHYCPLRNKIIEDGDCFETVMAVLREHSIINNKKIREKYPNCEKVCNECEFNKERE